MHSIKLSFLLVVALLATSARAADVDVLRQFGVLGRLALNCSAPASNANPHLVFAVSAQGQASWTLAMATPDLDGTWAMLGVKLIAPDQMQYRQVEDQTELTISIRKVGGKFRSWRSVSANGEILIADGKFTGNGAATPAFTFCGG